MTSIKTAGFSALFLVALCAGGASAEDVAAKKIMLKDNQFDPTKRQIMLMAKDPGILYSEADSPGTKGASIHVYSATDDYCAVLDQGATWTNKPGKSWKYKDATTKNQALIQDGKFIIKLKSGVTYTLVDNGTQGTVKATVQFGDSGVRYCMVCSTPTKDNIKLYLDTNCTAAACTPETGGCLPSPTTTTTTDPDATTTTSTTTTTLPRLVVGAIASNGRFNLNLGTGIPAAQAACNTSFPGSQLCRYSDLQASVSGGQMIGLKDTDMNTVTSFWAYDPTATHNHQCGATLTTGPDWTYSTGHVGVGGNSVTLLNASGTLGALIPGGDPGPRNCSLMKWIGCCH